MENILIPTDDNITLYTMNDVDNILQNQNKIVWDKPILVEVANKFVPIKEFRLNSIGCPVLISTVTSIDDLVDDLEEE